MAETPSFVVYTGDGATTDFAFPFPYLDASHIKVSVDGVEVPFELISQNSLRVSPAPAGGTRVRIYRQTPSEPLTSWADGAVILGKDLNLATKQPSYVAQEGRDVSDEAYFAANQAAASAAEAAQSAADAVQAAQDASQASAVHAERAETAADSAEAAATAANLSASSALGSADIAVQRAIEAEIFAQRAESAALLLEDGFHMHEIEHVIGLQEALDGKADLEHTHDEYYEKSEVDAALAGKSDTGHTHDDRYYTESEIDTKLAEKSDTNHTHAAYEASLAALESGKQNDLGLTGKASASDIRQGTTDKAVEPSAVWLAAQFQNVPFSATMTIDFNNGWNVKIVMTGDGTIANPQNAKPGQSGIIEIYQDATGNRLGSFGSNWRFAENVVPDLSTGANKKDVLSYFVLSDGTIFAALANEVP